MEYRTPSHSGVSLAMWELGSHSVTCNPAQVNIPRLNPRQTGRYSLYVPRRDGRLSWPSGVGLGLGGQSDKSFCNGEIAGGNDGATVPPGVGWMLFLDQELIPYRYNILILLLSFPGRPLQKAPRLRRFKSARDNIWQNCSASNYASIDGVNFTSFCFYVTVLRCRPLRPSTARFPLAAR